MVWVCSAVVALTLYEQFVLRQASKTPGIRTADYEELGWGWIFLGVQQMLARSPSTNDAPAGASTEAPGRNSVHLQLLGGVPPITALQRLLGTTPGVPRVSWVVVSEG